MARCLQGHSEGPPRQEENEVIKYMWKVLVVICALGNPCTMFEEDPAKFYLTEKECMAKAEIKARDMVKTYKEMGYYIDSEAHSCLYVVGQTEA